MKSFLSKKYTRAPLWIGFILNILIICGMFYFVTKNIFTDFSFKEFFKLNFIHYTLQDGINKEFAFSFLICFYVYTFTSIVITALALINKEPLFLCVQCIIDFFLGVFKFVYDYFQIGGYDSDTKLVLYFLMVSTFMFIVTSAIFETTLRKHHKPKFFLILDILSFLPVFLPAIISFFENNVFKTANPIIVLNETATNLFTTLAWIALPNFVVLYCAQFSADKGFKKDTQEKAFTEAMPLTIENKNTDEVPTTNFGLAPRKTGEFKKISTQEINRADIEKQGLAAKSKILNRSKKEKKEEDIVEPASEK